MSHAETLDISWVMQCLLPAWKSSSASFAVLYCADQGWMAQVRSSKQDQIHNSIVSTLLALMDGLDTRGSVVVIGQRPRTAADCEVDSIL